MGILNATPDSFSGDGLGHDPDALLARGRAQVAAGAEWIDVGGESTRPGATPVPEEEELRRVLPLVRRLAAELRVPVSIDTTKPGVADAALAAGATMLNDVSGLRDEALLGVARAHDAFLVIAHNGWTLRDRGAADEGDPLERVAREIQRLAELALSRGIREGRLVADPGLGFGKGPADSLALVRRTEELRERIAPLPLLVGPSRKSFVGRALGLPVEERLEGTLAAVAMTAAAGAELIRVHDVGPSVRAARMGWAIRTGELADGRA